MKFQHLTGIILLLSQATSISAAMLIPRMESGSEMFPNPMDDIRAAIRNKIKSGEEHRSPNDRVARLAQKLGHPFLIPIRVHHEWHHNEDENYVTNDSEGNLNLWVLVRNGKQIHSSIVNWHG
ncbi:BgTH12-02063 [Blumeria graminis f. sp. triticale]|uniref:BgtE-20063 n=3 Tax=Blumeria graminis TaxID=34373 RepID=A0A381L1C5_BLUGR|nr:BgTH12-02062 [Blumeria graminis f. sp. triticale]CAD6501817.1 BgTH12-02063 [Blumeria graminis f. sp. triticale]VDB85660.1 BgtE-20063 [Blumeria graminis f. sp. tritici]